MYPLPYARPVEAIRSFNLILPSGLIIVLDNCHFAPTVTRVVVSISRLVNNGYIHTFTNYGISASKDNVFYFNAILRDGLYEIDMHNLYLNMKSYLDTLERLGYRMPKELGVSLILISLNKDYDQFVQDYNMHSMGKTLAKLHTMLKLHEKGIPKKAETLVVLAIREGKIQKDKKKPQGAKGKGKGKNKLAYAHKAKIPPPPKRDNPAKDSICHHCKEVGHWRSNYPSYHVELKKRKNISMASTSGIFTI
nr:zinc finger, CCHC-type [Tanacetum cinerariifolium]